MRPTPQPGHLCHRSRPGLHRDRGARIWNVEGWCSLDGAMVRNIGLGNPRVLDATRRQTEKAPAGHRLRFETEASERPATLTAPRCPAGVTRVFFVAGGCEGADSAIKRAGRHAPANGAHCAAMLERLILREGPQTVLAFMREPAGGAPAGAITARDDIVAAVPDAGGLLHGFTHAGTPLACAAAIDEIAPVLAAPAPSEPA